MWYPFIDNILKKIKNNCRGLLITSYVSLAIIRFSYTLISSDIVNAIDDAFEHNPSFLLFFLLFLVLFKNKKKKKKKEEIEENNYFPKVS